MLFGHKGTGNLWTANLPKKVCSILVDKTNTDSDRCCRWIYFYDESGNSIGNTAIYDPIFKEGVGKQSIPGDHELVGVSLSLNPSSNWLNFLVWPKQQPIP